MNLFLRALAGGSVFLGGIAHLAAMRNDDDIAQERAQAFTWFGSLGYPDVKGRPLVHVATGQWAQFGGDPPVNRHRFGFLLKDGETFTVLTMDLEVQTFKKTPASTAPHKQVRYEKVNLAELGNVYLKTLPKLVDRAHKDGLGNQLWKANLKALHKGANSHEKELFHAWERFLSQRTELFVLGWACWRQGLVDLAAGFYDQARSMPGRVTGRGDISTKTLHQEVADDLAYAEMWRAVTALPDPNFSRAQLLGRFERFLKDFPESEYLPRARETAALLKQMVREDEDHAGLHKNGKPFEQLSKKEQIAELIFQLRDQNGWLVFMTLDGKEMQDSPAHRLVKMGYQAIPPLIEVLEDKRFTRSVGYTGFGSGPVNGNDYFSRHVLRVGESAKRIIERIARRSFYVPGNTNEAIAKNADIRRLKSAVQEWYAELQKKGEKCILIEATGRGDDNSPSQGELLLEKYPGEALPTLIKGARLARGYPLTRVALVRLVGQIKSDDALTFLLEEVNKGPFLVSRLEAARSLHARNRREGLAAMIAEWNGGLPVDRSEDMWADKSSFSLEAIAKFLASSGKVEAIEALAKDLHKRPGRP